MNDTEWNAYEDYEKAVEAAWDEYWSVRKEYEVKVSTAEDKRRARVSLAKARLDKALGK